MTIDIFNQRNEKVGSLDLSDEVFGGRVKADLIHESVVRANAAARRGTHATKNRALVSGSGKKPWRQKGTGRARVGEIRNPLWRKGGTVFGPQPRSYDYQLPRKVEKGALRAAITQKLRDGAVMVVDELSVSEIKTKTAAEMLRRLGVDGKALLVDVKPEDRLALSVRNIEGVRLLPSNRVSARDVVDTRKVVLKLTDVIRRPLITEKTTVLREDGRTLVFQVAKDANKIDIKRAVESLLHAKVDSVRTSLAHGKVKRQGRFVGRRSDWKKAYVTLREGEKLPEFLQGA
jgi:large subunit ribosomal protein L4